MTFVGDGYVYVGTSSAPCWAICGIELRGVVGTLFWRMDSAAGQGESLTWYCPTGVKYVVLMHVRSVDLPGSWTRACTFQTSRAALSPFNRSTRRGGSKYRGPRLRYISSRLDHT
jgi:hypothetical protein